MIEVDIIVCQKEAYSPVAKMVLLVLVYKVFFLTVSKSFFNADSKFGSGCRRSMFPLIKLHFQKNFISENKVHCVLNRARTRTDIGSTHCCMHLKN